LTAPSHLVARPFATLLTIATLALVACGGPSAKDPAEARAEAAGWTLLDGGWWATVAPLVASTPATPGTPTPAGYTLSNDLLFEFGSSALDQPARAVIADVAADLLARGVSVSVHGFSDVVGSDDVNLPLSRERAQAVADAMVDAGFPAGRIAAVESHGSADPRALPADTPSNRALNRRVEIRVV
jgi:outer membrane protein OmpA-like peptidoglycan-associated protein